jgi:hypothetical protein
VADFGTPSVAKFGSRAVDLKFLHSLRQELQTEGTHLWPLQKSQLPSARAY